MNNKEANNVQQNQLKDPEMQCCLEISVALLFECTCRGSEEHVLLYVSLLLLLIVIVLQLCDGKNVKLPSSCSPVFIL